MRPYVPIYFSEPNGAVPPRIKSKVIEVKDVVSGARFVGLCQSQGFPVPVFR